MNTVTDFGDTMMASMSGAIALFFSAIPRLIGFVLILIIGWFIATLIGKAVAALLHAVKFNILADRAGISEFIRRTGMQTDASGFLGEIIKWFLRLIVMVIAFDALGLPAISAVLAQFLLWLPNLIVALVIIVLGGLAAQALEAMARGAASEADFSKPDLLAKVAKTAVWIFTIVIAVNQLGIAVTLINTLFMGFVGALALALGLAFGLGGKDTASKIVAKWYDKSDDAASKIEHVASIVTDPTNPRQ
ncbi:mechanosensitive ion channel family protein [Glaciimonas immobilis]|uniref:Small-conductance mechanosensitive channel n=1 Tax=Glaciimonas immobilis TaxID=728004 RepID=A0A840RVB2_9BURK|nr:small-conductance mechanosensitive ion channel [Glaciimonas immobilis]KAF3996599.1 small-conductance mechanosensitive ion channel [Glaciimonas immobilis]MBB5201028.1 small-conductance mechanosensitive channel [Glaciimonas immobilis]